MQMADFTTIPEAMAVIKIGIISTLAFFVALAWTPLLTLFLYKYKIGIKTKTKSVDGQVASIYHRLHKTKTGTPTMGGVLVWVTVLMLISILHFLVPMSQIKLIQRLDFLSRSQTWLPLFVLVVTALLGAIDDYMSVRGLGGNKGGGLRFLARLGWLIVIASLGAYWFHFKLGYDSIHLPGFGDFEIGWYYIPFFVFIFIATAISSNETDGLDGLNAGILAIAFACYGVFSFFEKKMDLAAFCGAIVGSLLAFLWFNIYPARFFMGDTGAVSLGSTLAVIAMLTDQVVVLPIIVIIYVIESLSVIIQLTSKKLFHRKVFLSAPIHHHFEAIGWPETKVTMRAWVLTAVFASIGLIIGVLGMGK